MIWLAISSGALATLPSASRPQGPTPINYTNWVMPTARPAGLFEGDRDVWTIRARLTVRPDGKVQDCAIERSSRNKALDRFTCGMFEQRATLRPATWIDGSPSYGVFRFTFQWTRPQLPSFNSDPVDLELKADRRDYAGRLPAFVRVVFAVDQNGRISDCYSAPPFDAGMVTNPPPLVPLACDAVIHRYVPIPAKDASGTPVRSVQNAFVRIRND
jgi:hypothetical protein